MSSPDDAGVTFSLRVPASWFELDLSPATRDASLAALVQERVAEVPELREHRSTVTRLLRQQAREAWDTGARYCACMVEPDPDGPITASVAVSVVRGPLGVRPGEREHLEALLAPLTPKAPAGPDDTWCRVAQVELADGTTGARTWGVEDVDLPQDGGWVRVVSTLLLVPVPTTDRVVMVACSSPVLGLSDVLLDLFDAVCGTLQGALAGCPVPSPTPVPAPTGAPS